MPSASSFADFIRDWQQLIAAYTNNAANVTAGQPLLPELQALLNQALELKSRQENLTAAKQQITKEIREVKRAATEIALRMRSHAKGSLGTESEVLKEFNVAPRRKRGPRKNNKNKTKKPATEQPTTTAQTAATSEDTSGAQPAAKSSQP
jgi:hypothetical protein